jgi:predicted  nucleic acid-binding Zn-ribbon protein
LEAELATKTAELTASIDKCNALEARVAELETEYAACQAELEKVRAELKVLTDCMNTHETSSVARNKYEELEAAHVACQGDN